MTVNPHCRIGRVRLKAAPNLVVHKFRAAGTKETERVRAALYEHARHHLDLSPELDGFVVVAWSTETINVSWSYRENSPMNDTMLPGFAADAIRHHRAKRL